MRINELRSQGFVPAKKEDLEFVAVDTNDQDGAVIQNDVILMKIHKAKLFARYKNWMDIARKRGGSEQYRQIAAANASNQNLSFYLTPQAKNEFQGIGPVQNMQEFHQENQ